MDSAASGEDGAGVDGNHLPACVSRGKDAAGAVVVRVIEPACYDGSSQMRV
ncbi:hypothetical protein BJ994_003255 [Arthrobacter pigmenti]|uniref:Uncharacterized protein n=1 Tax=Arthrobacter pigmenti TaxID=271432 RepID=A0A846RSZ8_9MICC|nr:hypothetical protein [Arthrobacter pigmenti]